MVKQCKVKFLFKFVTGVVIILSMTVQGIGQSKGDDIIIGKYDKVFSRVLNEERTVLISLPEGYDHSDEKYPVLYVLDGSPLELADAFSMITRLSYGEIPQMIIVAITNTNRLGDMLPEEDNEKSAKSFLSFITDELFPYIEKNYRSEKNRILYGGSNAGLFTLYSFLENPDSFSAYITGSPTVVWRYEYMVNKTKSFTENQTSLNQFIYITYGGKDYPEVIESLPKYLPMLESMQEKGLRLKTQYFPEEGHVPFGSLRYGILSLFEDYAYPDEKRRNENVDSLKTYYERFSDKIGFKVKYSNMAVQGLGQRLLFRDKKYDAAIEVFKLGVSQHPGFWANNIMLAIAYYKNGDIELAKEYYLKSKEISPEGEDIPFEEYSEMRKKWQ